MNFSFSDRKKLLYIRKKQIAHMLTLQDAEK